MAAPPRGDPRRPLRLAARICQVVGALTLLLGASSAVVRYHFATATRPGLTAAGIASAEATGVATIYFVFALHLRRRRRWAVVAALSVTAVAVLYMTLSTVVTAANLHNSTYGSPALRGTYWALTVSYGLIVGLLCYLTYCLARCFGAIRIVAVNEDRGFAVLPVAVPPAERPATGGGDADGHAE